MHSTLPELWLIAGPNGAGKTTFSHRKPLQGLLSHVHLLNADDLTLQVLQSMGFATFDAPDPVTLKSAFVTAAEGTMADLESRLQRHEAVAVETVLSTEKYKPSVETVAAAGGFVGLIYVALRSSELACQRVRKRYAQGGHDVPDDKIRVRWQRSLETLPWFAARADLLLVYDNSNDDPHQPPHLLATGHRGRIVIHDEIAIPAVTAALKKAHQGD